MLLLREICGGIINALSLVKPLVFGAETLDIATSSPTTATHTTAAEIDLCEVVMGDVADILGLGGPPSASGRASPVLGGPLGPLQENKRGKGAVVPSKKGKPQGVSREVYALLGSEGLPPEVGVLSCIMA